MRDLKVWLIAGASCLVLCHAMPQPDPDPNVNVDIKVDINGPKNDDVNVNVDVNIGRKECEEPTTPSVISTKPSVTLETTSDSWTVTEPETVTPTTEVPCPSFYDDSGTITHPEYGNYSNNENICWAIVTSGSSIEIEFSHFETEGCCDFVSISELDTITGVGPVTVWLGEYSGHVLPPIIRTTANQAIIRFTSDHSIVFSGFALSWNTVDKISSTTPPTLPTISTTIFDQYEYCLNEYNDCFYNNYNYDSNYDPPYYGRHKRFVTDGSGSGDYWSNYDYTSYDYSGSGFHVNQCWYQYDECMSYNSFRDIGGHNPSADNRPGNIKRLDPENQLNKVTSKSHGRNPNMIPRTGTLQKNKFGSKSDGQMLDKITQTGPINHHNNVRLNSGGHKLGKKPINGPKYTGPKPSKENMTGPKLGGHKPSKINKTATKSGGHESGKITATGSKSGNHKHG